MSDGENSSSGSHNFLGPLGVAAALVVSVFAAIGLSGDLLVRAARDAPVPIAIGVLILLLAASLVALSRLTSWVDKAAVLLALISIAVLLVVAATSYARREIPQVQIAATAVEDGVTSISVNAGAHGLRTDEKMLLQVVGLTEEFTAHRRSHELCAGPISDSSLNSARRDGIWELLLWVETGADGTGRASTTTEIPVDVTRYRQVCAYAALGIRPNDRTQDHRFTWALWSAPIDPNRPLS